MECAICLDKINNDPLQVKEMMFGTGKFYTYFKCKQCGCVQIEKPEKSIENLYPRNYYSFNTYNISGIIKKIKRLIVRNSVASALGYKSFFNFLFAVQTRDGGAHALKGRAHLNSKILDVGCGDGSLIDGLAWCGFKDLTGIDPFLHSDVIQSNYQLLKKSVEELAGHEIFDIIMLHHSFEHVENPSAVISHIKRLLKKDGLCIIRIPVADSYAFDFYKEHWVQLDAPRHVFLHTNKSMDMLALKNNLRLESIVDDSMEFQFIGSEQYKKGIGLTDSRSYYVSPHKKFFFNKKHLFSKTDIEKFKKQATVLNQEGRGDQRIYYIKHS
jgi:SAM-dependent methyltransferase